MLVPHPTGLCSKLTTNLIVFAREVSAGVEAVTLTNDLRKASPKSSLAPSTMGGHSEKKPTFAYTDTRLPVLLNFGLNRAVTAKYLVLPKLSVSHYLVVAAQSGLSQKPPARKPRFKESETSLSQGCFWNLLSL